MKIALLGFGVVGKGVYDIIKEDFKEIEIKYILVKNKDKHKDIKHLLADDYKTIINDDDIDVVIECISTKAFAYDAVKLALEHHKHVVTANKAIMSEHFEELTSLAKANHVQCLYEGSVGGAVIVLDPLKRISLVNKIYKIEGILNGSTNYILSRVFLDHVNIDKAIEEANDLGYLETGSDDDMTGLDPARKINIASMIAYHTYIKEEDILRLPLTKINNDFINEVKSKGLLMKYIARSEISNGQLSIILEPMIINKLSLYAKINFEDNIINVYGKYHKRQAFVGQGAGRYPTAQAMIYDLLNILDDQKIDLIFDQKYRVENNDVHCFLVQEKETGFDYRKSTYSALLDDEDVICFARLEEGLLETM